MQPPISLLLLLTGVVSALNLNVDNVDSISSAAKTVVSTIMSIYDAKNGSQIPGIFPAPYYWWESGLAWDSLINYWSLTGDDTYNDRVSQAMLFQIGPNNDYLPPNQTKSEGNDDESTWALAAMTAAENGFPEPKASDGIGSWVELAQNVFDAQAARWDDETCGGGLRWQLYPFIIGYNYKNSMSNGNFMQLASRLAAFTGNATYSEWAVKSVQWALDIGLIAEGTFDVYDGANTEDNCKQPMKLQWSGNIGTYLSGYAYLSNAKQNAVLHTQQLLDSAIKTFAVQQGTILEEVTCAPKNSCNTDQKALLAILARALANVKYVDTSENIDTSSLDTVLQDSAKAAAASCSGGADGTACGSDWTSSKFNGSTGLGQELSALEIMLANLPRKAIQTSNGTSEGGSSAGGAANNGTSGSPAGTNGAGGLTASTFGLLSVIALAVAFVL